MSITEREIHRFRFFPSLKNFEFQVSLRNLHSRKRVLAYVSKKAIRKSYLRNKIKRRIRLSIKSRREFQWKVVLVRNKGNPNDREGISRDLSLRNLISLFEELSFKIPVVGFEPTWPEASKS